jgi:hypothetical protein
MVEAIEAVKETLLQLSSGQAIVPLRRHPWRCPSRTAERSSCPPIFRNVNGSD